MNLLLKILSIEEDLEYIPINRIIPLSATIPFDFR